MKKNLLSIFIVAFILSASVLRAQIISNGLDINDSLLGFNEATFISNQVNQGVSGNKLKKALGIAKKEFKYEKYFHQHNSNLVWKTAQTNSVNPGCTNMDFEAGSFAGWTVTKGVNANSTTMAGCCPNTAGIVSAVIPGSGNDPICGGLLPLTSPFGGTNIARINDANTGAVVERLSQSFNVTSSNAIFQLAYAGVLENAAHSCSDQPFMNISVIDSAGNVLACPKIDIAAPSNLCAQSPSVTTGWTPFVSGFDDVFYHTWDIKTIDLSPYIGTSITIQITVGDCAQTGHYGYGYFDCRCNPLEISLNGTVFDATPQTPINVSTCGATNATLIAPLGLDPYTWNGPAGSGVTGVTTQSMVTSTPATYTLTMDPLGSCYGIITKFIILNATPNPTVSSITSQATCTNATGSGTINVLSGTSPFTYNWSPAASTNSMATGLSPGVDYTVNVVDTFGCQGSAIVSIASFTNAPSYTINPLSANLSCLSNSLNVTSLTGLNTTAVWTHTNTPNFVVTSAGSFSCVVTNTLSLCTATVPITITSNTIAPIATYTLLCNSTTVNLNANSTAGIALGWLAPGSPPTPVSNPGSSTAAGVFTLTATNLTTGCKTTYTVENLIPNITVATNPTSNNLTCITNSILATATSTTTGVNITWTNGVTTFTTNPLPILTAGNYTTNVSAVGGCSTQTVITITSNTLAGVNVSVPTTIIPCSTNSLAITANPTVGGPYSYVWTPSTSTATNNIYSVSDAGTYTVTATNSVNGCTTSAVQTVTHETVTASFVANPYQGLMPLPVSFTNTSSNATNYSWNLGNGMTYTTTNAATIYNVQGTYAVILTATNGFCTDTAVRIIQVDLVSTCKVPNVFTPNGDGKNDYFSFDAVNMGEITFYVFDRWGLKMYEITTTGNVKWDGKNKGGSIVSDGTYFYILKATGLDNVKYDLQGTINVFQ